MKNILIITFIALAFGIITDVNAQRNKDVVGSISGFVMDKSSGEPLESATIQVFKAKDSTLVTGGTTEKNGFFKIENVQGGKYNVLISYIGYNSAYRKDVLITGKEKDVDIGTIKLSLSTEMTDVIEVITEAPIMTMDFDKKVYNVEKDIVSQTGSATDILKNIPSVTVDNDGNVSIRGNGNIKILINGKPSGLFGGDDNTVLENIPATSIEKVEVINNPSAKYEAEGVGGIINLILKQNQGFGYNGNLSISSGFKDRYNINAGIRLKQEKYALSLNYSWRKFTMTGTGDGFRENLFSDSLRFLDQNSEFNGRMNSHFLSAGFDYYFTKQHSLSLSAGFNVRDRKRDEQSNSLFTDINNIFNSSFISKTFADESGNNIDISLTHKLEFEKKGQELISALSYSYNKNDQTKELRVQDYDINNNPLNNTPDLEENIMNGKYNFITFQSDYVHPLSEDSRLEAGLKFNYKNILSDQMYNTFDYNTNTWVPEILKNNNSDYTDYIPAAYLIFSNKYKNFSYKAGLRAEYTSVDFKVVQNSNNYSSKYFSLFPSLFLSQKIGKTNEVQFNYARRINRPNMRYLNPFTNYSDPFNLNQGNPKLNPEYINSLELGYVKYLDFAVITASVFFRNTDDPINWYRTVDSNGVSLVTFKNLGTRNNYGIEFISQASFTKWWNTNINFSYFKMDSKGNDGMKDFDNSTYSYTAKLMSNMSIPNLFDFQLSYFYMGRTVSAQGIIQPYQSFDVAFKKDFFFKRLSISLQLSDIFNQQINKYNTSGTGFISENIRKRDSRMAMLTLTYRFGNDEITSGRKKEGQRENGNENQMPEPDDY